MRIEQIELRVVAAPVPDAVQDVVRGRVRQDRADRHRAQRWCRGLRRRRDGPAADVPRGDARGSARVDPRRARARPPGERLRASPTSSSTGGPGTAATTWPRPRSSWRCGTAHARQQGVPMRQLLGGERTEIPVGASLGMSSIPADGRIGAAPRRRGVPPGEAEDRAGLGPRPARRGPRRRAGRRADGRRELRVHARRHRAAAEPRRVPPPLHRAAAALGRPRRPRRARAAAGARRSASTSRSPPRPACAPRSTSARAAWST